MKFRTMIFLFVALFNLPVANMQAQEVDDVAEVNQEIFFRSPK